jgi:hypothetical protein
LANKSDGLIRLDAVQVKMLYNRTALPRDSGEEYVGGDEEYIGSVEMFHQLHCLVCCYCLLSLELSDFANEIRKESVHISGPRAQKFSFTERNKGT